MAMHVQVPTLLADVVLCMVVPLCNRIREVHYKRYGIASTKLSQCLLVLLSILYYSA